MSGKVVFCFFLQRRQMFAACFLISITLTILLHPTIFVVVVFLPEMVVCCILTPHHLVSMNIHQALFLEPVSVSPHILLKLPFVYNVQQAFEFEPVSAAVGHLFEPWQQLFIHRKQGQIRLQDQ